ncbi:MAG: endonuclease III [Candidatus Omnitrophica bacterium]|nr:endonuclease III [Candidatus Omnitrophota bacterium]
MDKKEIQKIYSILKKKYHHPEAFLLSENIFELLVAVILSAQCTDERVNKVTKVIFKKYKSIKDYAGAKQEVFEQDIRSTGFYRNKAKNIIKTANIINDSFNGKVPCTMEELVILPGVARKTSNIILYHGYGKNEGIAVDTHVKRVCFRLGLTKNTDPNKIEQDLIKIIPQNDWGDFTNIIIGHGRAICDARKPLCVECQVVGFCEKNGVNS